MKWMLLLALILETGLAYADGGRVTVPNHPKWKEECGSCHIPYPPQFLTGADWQRLMGGLNKHFGENAVVDQKDSKEILVFLKSHAGSGASHSASSLRISDTAWFTRTHHEVSSKAWTDPAIKSRANCTACHVNAANGDWSERGVRMPAGLDNEEGDEESDDEGGED